MWEFALEEGAVEERRHEGSLEFGKLPQPYYFRHWRAFKTLPDRYPGRVDVKRRKFRGFDEIETYYPAQTSELEVLRLRERLLPFLSEVAVSKSDGRFEGLRQEEHLLTQLFGRRPTSKREILGPDWEEIETALFGVLASLQPGADRDAWWRMTAQGRYLFMGMGNSVSTASFESLMGNCNASSAEVGVVLDSVVRFYRSVFPPTKRAYVGLKGQLYRVVSFERYERARLLPATVRQLHTADSEFVEGLPGHLPPTLKRNRQRFWSIGFNERLEPFYSPILDKLVERNALNPVLWIRRTD